MGGYDEGTEERRAAAGTIGAILLGTLVAFGPGGIHGLAYWSSRPSAEPPTGERAATEGAVAGDTAGGDPDPSGLDVVDAEAGAARGERDATAAAEPRIPLGQEPLPALPHEIEERLRSAWDQAPITADTEPPRLAATGAPPADPPADIEERTALAGESPAEEQTTDETDELAPRLVGAAPASDAEVLSSLARQAGAEAARAFGGEMNALLAPQDPAAEGELDEAAPFDDRIGADLEEEDVAQQSVADTLSEQDVWAQTTPPRSPEQELQERMRREQERAQSAAMTAWAIQQALIPLFAGMTPAVPRGLTPGSEMAPGSVVPVTPPVTSTGTPMPSLPPGVGMVGAPELPPTVMEAPAGSGGLTPFGFTGEGGVVPGAAGAMPPGTSPFGEGMGGGLPAGGTPGGAAGTGGGPLGPAFPPSAPIVPGAGLAPGTVMPPGSPFIPVP